MIKKVRLDNFGPLKSINWQKTGKINLIIGPNGSGKTYLLKALYSSTKTLEEYKRGQEYRSVSEILADKLYWNFQSEKIGDIVGKGENKLSVAISYDDKIFDYGFGKDTKKQITRPENNVISLGSNSLFLPAKEVLSLQRIIIKSREIDKEFGFDDTYYDLAKALLQLSQKGRKVNEFSKSRKLLQNLIKGRLKFDENQKVWLFINENNQKFQIGLTAEGIKKIAILDTLLSNRYLGRDSMVFIDEPEAALHPAAISKFMDMIELLSQTGMQFFFASHSYFVIKKLFLIAQEKQISIPVLSCDEDVWKSYDLKEGMPGNSIIDESIRLYKEQVEKVFE